MRAPELGDRAHEPRLVLPVGDGIGSDVADVELLRQRRRVGPDQVPDRLDAVCVEPIGRLRADRGAVHPFVEDREEPGG